MLLKHAYWMAIIATVAASAFAEKIFVTNLSDYASGAGGLRVRVGDWIHLPILAEDGGSYAVGNARIGTLLSDGRTVEILEPGILAIHHLPAGGSTADATMCVLSLPDAPRVFIWNERHWDAGSWSSKEGAWRLVGPETTDDFPRLANDVAIMPRYDDGWGKEITISTNVVLGGLYYGSVRDFPDNQAAYAMKLRSGNGSHLAFLSTRINPAVLRFCPNMTMAGHRTFLQFGDGGQPLVMDCNRSVEVDYGWDGTDMNMNLACLMWTTNSTLNVGEGSTITFCGASPHQDGPYHADIDMNCIITGSGTLHNHGRENMCCNFSDASGFTGTLVDSSREHASFDRDATLWFKECETLTRAAVRVDGFVVRTDYKSFPPEKGAGYIRIGTNHDWPGQKEVGNRLPGRALILNGGHVDLLNERTVWSEGAVNRYSTGVFSVSNGFSLVTVQSPDNDVYPDTYFHADRIEHPGKATVAFHCNRLWTSGGSTNVEVNLPDFSAQAVGGILPWMVAWKQHPNNDWDSLMFPVADGDGNLRPDDLVSTSVADAAIGSNVYCDGKDLAIPGDKTINTLVLKNLYGGNKRIGKDRTLTIESGGLVLGSYTSIGEYDANADDPLAECGTLAFGGTAYVYPSSFSFESGNGQRSCIMSSVMAPEGFVCGFPGYMTLCGDQRGIDDEIVVQAGMLTLGFAGPYNGTTLDLPCKIDVPVRIVGGGSTLSLAPVTGTTLSAAQNVYFDDVGGHAGKLELPASAHETCYKCYVDGVAIPNGIYGSSEAKAQPDSKVQYVDDEHFSGPGTLRVLWDDGVRYTAILIR